VEIDLLSAASFAHGQPHDQYRWLRANDPCHFHPEPSGPGFWALTRYDDVRSIGRNPATFSSWPTMTIADRIALRCRAWASAAIHPASC